MNFINKLERKYGRFGIHNLTMYIIICYVIGYVLNLIQPELLYYLRLEPALILKGQIWRLVTWVLIPPGGLNLFTIIMLFFYYSLGTTLERTWGTFRYTLFIFSGLFFTIIGAFILHFIVGGLVVAGAGVISVGAFFSTYYISLSIFLAFAISYPDMQVLLYFVIPIRIKWLAYVDIALLAYDIFNYVRSGLWMMVVPIAASLLNVVIFFFATRNMNHLRPKEVKRRQEFKKAVAKSQVSSNGITKHKCAICGRTEKDGDHLEFRFCSKCNGNFEYCQDHLFTHEHVK
ncbi:MAG: hypothetical protein ACOYBE_09775 [Blautia sp.]|jgi:hypothetical protein